MPRYKHHGKNIKKIELISGKLISDLVLEATAFDSLHGYAVYFTKYYRCSPRMIRRVKDVLKNYAIEVYGKDWCHKYYEKGGRYLSVAAKNLGVTPDRVIEHLIINVETIDLAVFSRLYFPENPIKAYNFFFSRIARYQAAE